jgi:hypothetical protein
MDGEGAGEAFEGAKHFRELGRFGDAGEVLFHRRRDSADQVT